MRFNHYVESLIIHGFREVGYFTGIRVFLGENLLITVEEYSGGYQVTFDSVARNIGQVYYVTNDDQLCHLIGEFINEN